MLFFYCFVDIQCDILSTPSKGGMSCSSGKVGVGYEGDTCSFTCNAGYLLTGRDTGTCQSNGSWSGNQTFCKQGTVVLCMYVLSRHTIVCRVAKDSQCVHACDEKICIVQSQEYAVFTQSC